MYQRRIKFIWSNVGRNHNIFSLIISFENLILAWYEFRKGKRKKLEIQKFELCLEDNLFKLHEELKKKTYHHSNYTSFFVQDPKLRHIHKANIRDRVLHQAIFRILYSIFNRGFIFDSYSSRLNKGTHKAVNRLEQFARKLSKNNSKNIFFLKCDIKKFFDSIDQNILLDLIKKKIQDKGTLWLVEKIVKSFAKEKNKGLPLGNVTSQLFANIYLNELDQFIKHNLKIRYYVRYCDDFVALNEDPNKLANLIKELQIFLTRKLKLRLHPDKMIIRKYHQGIDFLGYVLRPHYRVLRTKTKNRIFRKLKENYDALQEGLIFRNSFNQSIQSYFGILKHCRGYKIEWKINAVIREINLF